VDTSFIVSINRNQPESFDLKRGGHSSRRFCLPRAGPGKPEDIAGGGNVDTIRGYHYGADIESGQSIVEQCPGRTAVARLYTPWPEVAA
jgi:hypothetical protein